MKVKFNSNTALIILLVVFIVFDIHLPTFANDFINTYFGKFVLLVISLSLFAIGPFVGILGVIAILIAMFRTGFSLDSLNMNVKKFIPSENKRSTFFKNTMNNQFPKTLEEEMVKHMVPYVRNDNNSVSFSPSSNSIHDASKYK